MAIKHIARQYDYVGLSTDDKTIIATEGAVIYYTDTKTREIYHDGNWTEYWDNVDLDLAGVSISVDNVGIKDADTNETAKVDVNGNLLVKAGQDIHDNFNVNANLQIDNVDVGGANPVPTKNENKTLPLIFHDEAIISGAGLEFEVGEYKNLRVGISGTATSHEIRFRGESGGVITPLTGIKEDGLVLGTSTTLLDEVWEFDIESFDKIWFGLFDVAGGNISVKGKAGN